jgi:hypothetical protein
VRIGGKGTCHPSPKFGRPQSFHHTGVGVAVRGLHRQDMPGFQAPDRGHAGRKRETHGMKFLANSYIIKLYVLQFASIYLRKMYELFLLFI